MKQRNNIIITSTLYLLIIFFSVEVVQAGYNYYKGPTWTVEAYMKAIEKGEYNKAYKYLNADSIDPLVNEQQMIAYYKQIYHYLRKAERTGNVQLNGEDVASCKVIYMFQNKNEEGRLQLIRNNKHWEIISPFKTSSVTVYASTLSDVYINGKKIKQQKEGVFIEEGLLPGDYMLQVVMKQSDYKDYYQMINVPKQEEIFLPYDMVSVGVQTVKGMEINLDTLSKVANKSITTFSDILPGEYNLTIKSPYDTVIPIEKQITIGNTSCHFNYQEMQLSEKGESTWKSFMSEFYNAYLKGIKSHEVSHIANYFEGKNKSQQLNLYNEWFIANKDVQDAKLQIETQLGKITQDGYLQSEIMEVIELTNLEEVEGEDTEKVYRLVLKWDVQLDIMKEEWQIIERNLKESIISYKAEDGRWIQY